MNTLHTLDEVYEVVKERSRSHHDEHVPVSNLRFDSLNRLSIGDTKHSLTKQAQQQIANRLRIPHSYLSRCSEHLQAENLNTWLDQERNENLFLRFNGNQVRAIFTPRYKPYDHTDLIRFLLSNGFEGSRELEYSVDEEMLMLNLITPQDRIRVQPNDELRSGFSFRNSEIGVTSLQASAYFLRLVCTNGLISPVSVSNRFRHVSEKILDSFPQLMHSLTQTAEEQKRSWYISLETDVDQPKETLNTFNQRFELSEQETSAVTWGWNQEPGTSMFHIVNAYTKAAQYPNLSTESTSRLQQTGGKILALLN